MYIEEIVYAAIRKHKDDEWIEVDTISHLYEVSKEKAEKTDRIIPQFAKENPVVRIGRFKIEEIAL